MWFIRVCSFSRLIVGRFKLWQRFNVSLRGRDNSLSVTVTSATLPTISKYCHCVQYTVLFCGCNLEPPCANAVPVHKSCLCYKVYLASVSRALGILPCDLLDGWLTHRWKPRDHGDSALKREASEPLIWAGYGGVRITPVEWNWRPSV